MSERISVLLMLGFGLGILFFVYIGSIAVDVARGRGWEDVDTVTEKWSLSGHALQAATAFTYWTQQGEDTIPPACAKCHSTFGFHEFLGQDGSVPREVSSPAPTGSVILCSACHNQPLLEWEQVRMPSGMEISDLRVSTVCAECHQGRASTRQVEEAIAGLPADEVNPELEFISVHYLPAAATLTGAESLGAYLYPDQPYAGRLVHIADYQRCAECHDVHSLVIEPLSCSPCHVNVVEFEDLRGIRTQPVDFIGAGDTNRGIAEDIAFLHERLYEALKAYAVQVGGVPLVYSPTQNPYFFQDQNGNGVPDEDELVSENAYPAWTPRALRTAYNYHYVQMDPGNYAHNPRFILQALYDSLADLSQVVPVQMEGLVRP